MKEMLDVYDINGNKTGEVVERYHHQIEGNYYLCIHAYIVTSDGKYILQKRSMEKKYFPGIWDITCGAADAGEDRGGRLGNQQFVITGSGNVVGGDIDVHGHERFVVILKHDQ